MSIWSDNALLVFCCVLAVAFGAVFGSFLNCAAYRIAHGESFLKGHSRCVSCGHDLGVPDLVPILSWVFLRGRCRYCGSKVSVRYPLTELAFAALTLLCLLRFDLTAVCLRNWVFVCCLFCLSLVDLENFTIPDGSLIIAVIAWVVAIPFVHMSWKEAGVSLLAGLIYGGGILGLSLILDKILQRDSLGGGDIKLFAVVGLYLGLVGTLFAVLLSAVLGLLFAAVTFVAGGKEESETEGSKDGKVAHAKAAVEGKSGKTPKEVESGKTAESAKPGKDGPAVDGEEDTRGHIPFGPSISLAAIIILYFGQGLISWYMGLLNI